VSIPAGHDGLGAHFTLCITVACCFYLNTFWKRNKAGFYKGVGKLSERRSADVPDKPIDTSLCSPVVMIDMIFKFIQTIKKFHHCSDLAGLSINANF